MTQSTVQSAVDRSVQSSRKGLCELTAAPNKLKEAQSPRRTEGFRSDIEGLRGVAVLLVVAFHSGLQVVPGGFVGVDVFFVISGYLITGLLVDETRRSGRIDFARFYARRVRRLLPAATLMTATVLCVGIMLLSPFEAKELAKAALASILFSSNMWFLRESLDYFAADAEASPLLHTWSLGVEEQFYLFWPLLIFFTILRGRTSRPLIVTIALISVLTFALCVVLTNVQQPWAFFAMPARAWQFGCGALAYLLPSHKHDRPLFHGIAGWAGFLAIAYAGFMLSRYGPGFPGVVAAIPTLGATAVLVAGRNAPMRGVGWLLSLPFLQMIGRLSYSWYLWHWPVLMFAAVAWPQQNTFEVTITVLASLLLAALAYAVVENPVRLSRYLSTRSALTLVGGVALTVASAAVSYGIYSSAKLALDSPAQRSIAAASEVQAKYRNCVVRARDSEVTECVFGAADSVHTVVLFGDSHALQWLPALEALANKHQFRLVTLNKTACPAVAVPVYIGVLKRMYRECSAWRDAALTRISRSHPSLVITSNSTDYLRQRNDLAPSLQEWSEGTRHIHARLASEGIPAIMIRDNPIPGRNIVECLSRAAWQGKPAESCSVRRSIALPDSVFAAEVRALRETRTKIFDFSDYICDHDKCPPIKNGTIVYRDSHHLSEGFVQDLVPALEAQLASTLRAFRGE